MNAEELKNDEWHDDKQDEWSEQIAAAHPIRSGNHAAYATALEMVSNRKSKAALVNLVCWLIQREQQARRKTLEEAAKVCAGISDQYYYGEGAYAAASCETDIRALIEREAE